MQKVKHLDLINRNWQTVASEAAALPQRVVAANRITCRKSAAALVSKPAWIMGWDGYENWLSWGLVLDGALLPGSALLPVTAEILRALPIVRFAALLLMKPGTTMRRHSHPENTGVTTYHLGLDVPEECYLNVNGKFIREETGKGFLFDGTLPHYAFNASSRDRLILHCEIDS